MHDSREDLESVDGEISDAQRERFEAARIRQSILEGYGDMIHGRTVRYQGNLRGMLEARMGDTGLTREF